LLKYYQQAVYEVITELTTATRNAPFKFAQASQQALVLRNGNHLCQLFVEPEEYPRMFPIAIQEQKMELAVPGP
jgi:hypothetical protein